MITAHVPESGTQNINRRRWRYLALGVLCMLMLANMQYAWTLFVHPLQEAHGWDIAAIQFAFTAFVALETWGTPVAGWVGDKLPPGIGPRIVIGVGAVLVAIGWGILSWAQSLHLLYLGGALTGVGTGAAYTTCVGIAAKWFKDRRGLAVGLIAAGYGTGTVLTVIPIRMVIAAYGYQSAFLWVGLLAGAVVLIASQFIRAPRPGEAPEPSAAVAKRETSRNYSPSQVVRKPVFWLLYLADVMMCAGGLAVTASLAPMAHSFGVANGVVLGGLTALSGGLMFAAICNGVARPFFGWVSDQIGRIPTMAIAFAVGAVAYVLFSVTAYAPWGFVVFAGMIMFSWGEIFDLFPATCTDLFGERYATTNLSMLYTAKGVASFLVPLGTPVFFGSWNHVLYVAAGINVIAVILVLAVIWPAANRHLRETGA